MKLDEFIEATTRLETYYDKEYNKEQLKIMHEELQNFSIERYKFLISNAIKKCKFLPKVADFFQIDKENPLITENQEKERIYCSKCNSSGYIIYTKCINNGNKKLEYKYAAICSCGNAKQYKGWEASNKANRSDNYIPLAKELNLI